MTTNKNLANLETAVKDTNKPDDISNNAIWAPDSISQLSKLREVSSIFIYSDILKNKMAFCFLIFHNKSRIFASYDDKL